MSVEALEARLATDLGRREAIAVGRGATAIWLALEGLREWNGAQKVVLPATLCTSPAAVVRLAGLTPVFCDVEVLTGNLDPIALAMTLAEHGGDVLCVIAAHLYGQPARIDDIARVCGDFHAPLIEDAAQAYGATVHGKPVGSFGDISIVSFGHTKIIDAGGGGALLTDHVALGAKLREKAGALHPPQDEIAMWSEDYRRDYYALQKHFNTDPQTTLIIGEMCVRYPYLYRYSLSEDQAQKVLFALDLLEGELAHRRASADLYKTELAEAPVTMLRTEGCGAPWRFNFLIQGGRRDAVVDALRAKGFDASSWYPVVARFFEPAPDWRMRWPGATRIEEEIVNLWVDNSVNESRVRGACAVIVEALERQA